MPTILLNEPLYQAPDGSLWLNQRLFLWARGLPCCESSRARTEPDPPSKAPARRGSGGRSLDDRAFPASLDCRCAQPNETVWAGSRWCMKCGRFAPEDPQAPPASD